MIRSECLGLLAATMLVGLQVVAAPVQGWLNWRGPEQVGLSRETNLIDKLELDGENHLWTYELPGRGAPVIANDRLYAFGYRGEGQDLQEWLVCLNADTGAEIWARGFNDFISDIIYNRYSIGSPTIDPDTGNVYLLTSPGLFVALSGDGTVLWQHSLMETFGRLTFPNGRTGCPVVDGDLVIVRGITANWGNQGPARDRFYAFDKLTGEAVWASTPGVGPSDSSFATPAFGWLGEQRVFYCGTGCGNMVCVNARTGKALSRFQLLHGGINSSILPYRDNTVIAIHGKENLDTSEIGRMVRVRMAEVPAAGAGDPVVLPPEAELWRNPFAMFTSSPVLDVDQGRIYQVTHTGTLGCVDAETGSIIWRSKLSNSQLHASPLLADGKLYVPMLDGVLHVLRPTDTGADELCRVQLEGNCLGAPAVWNGKIYVHTTVKLYCFGRPGNNPGVPAPPAPMKSPPLGAAVALQVIPNELLLRPGAKQSFRLRAIDANGAVVPDYQLGEVKWESFIPPGAKVQARMKAAFSNGELIVDPDNVPSAGAFKVTAGGLTGLIRGRVLPNLPITEDFESFVVAVPHTEEGLMFAYPPLPWIGARFKWEIHQLGDSKVLAKTLDRVLFQRTMTFLGHPDMKNYTVSADVMSDGNRRIMSTVGVINQRYIVALKGNWQQIEVSSNHDRIKVGVPFAWQSNVWYRLKARVDVAEDGSGVVRGKAWPRDQTEPEEWTIEVPHQVAHANGSPGLFGFSPQGKKRVYIDNISIVPNN